MKFSDSILIANEQNLTADSKLAELRKLIAVSEPYLALSNLRLKNGELSANLPLEFLDHLEPYGMAIPEIGRHMAILGSLALANTNPRKEKHYYLATHAIVERLHNKSGGDGQYFGKVRVTNFTKREGKITGELFSATGEPFCTVSVTYSILHESIFNRMFANEKQSFTTDKTHNPYAKASKLYNINLNDKNSYASLGVIKFEDCIGHFDNFPAMPIARLGGALTSLSGLHFNHLRNSNETFCIRKAEIFAKTFVFAGKKLNLFTHLNPDLSKNGICIESHANTDECNNVIDYKLWFY